MSRRPLPHQIERIVRQQNQMAPGGRVWSESPIPRRYTPRVPMAGEDIPPAGYTWPLDDLSGPATESGGGQALTVFGTVTRGAAPVAPGSTASMLWASTGGGVYSDLAGGTPPIVLPDSGGGWAGIDLWVSGMTLIPGTGSTKSFFWVRPVTDPNPASSWKPEYNMILRYHGGVPALTFTQSTVFGGSSPTTVAALTSLPTDMHIQWGIHDGVTMVIKVNGATLPLVAASSPLWAFDVPLYISVTQGGPTACRIDQLRLYPHAPS